jgi:hypothetical protein
MEDREFTFPNPETGGELTVFADKIRHPSKIIGVGTSIDDAIVHATNQINHIIRYGKYDHVEYGKGNLVIRNGDLFYCVPDVTLYRGTVIWH